MDIQKAASLMGKKSAAKLTKEERSERARKAVQNTQRYKKKLSTDDTLQSNVR